MGIPREDRREEGTTGTNDNDSATVRSLPSVRPAEVGRADHENANNMYKAYRDYIVHEDDLVNQRTTWSVTIEAFVIGIFGLTYQKKMEGLITFFGLDDKRTGFSINKMKEVVDVFDEFLIIIAVFGIGIALISGVAVYAAQHAIQKLGERWEDQCSKLHLCNEFPPLTGGGNRLATYLGHTFPLVLPGFFIVFWALAIVWVYVMQGGLMLHDIPPAPP